LRESLKSQWSGAFVLIVTVVERGEASGAWSFSYTILLQLILLGFIFRQSDEAVVSTCGLQVNWLGNLRKWQSKKKLKFIEICENEESIIK
jgi:hypothetical protein